jgi:hypothetical protein
MPPVHQLEGEEIVSMIEHHGDIWIATRFNIYRYDLITDNFELMASVPRPIRVEVKSKNII